jgi:Virulence-associated protein E/Bifunctional DNA primase/polymerase, N-terminal
MGIFSDNVRKYYEHGLITLPCKDKKPILGPGWEQFCNTMPDEKVIDKWEHQFKDAQQLGLVLGKATSLVGFDFDYEYDSKKCTISEAEFKKDSKIVEKQILALLPLTPAIKTGKKGWTRFFRIQTPLENAVCNRHGLRLFDFLARNKQTIIPPSKYNEGTELVYRWIAEPIENCIEDIPFINQEIIDEIKFLFSDSKSGYDFEGNGRHGRLFKWLLDILKLEQSDERVVEKLVEFDLKLNGKSAYLSDPKHFGSGAKQPHKNADKWIKRVRKFVNASPKNIIHAHQDGWNYFFENSFPKIKKDIISKDVFIKRDSEDWQSIRGLEGVIRSYAIEAKLKHSQVSDHLERWIFEKKETDFLCDIPIWDGSDRISNFGQSIKSEFFDSEDISDILKHWGSNIFRRVQSPDSQNRCVILKGSQGIGKDSLVRSMLKDFKPYYESTTLPGNQKDILEIVSRLLVVHIEEFDQTKNIDISFLKSLITQPSAFFRESYGYSPNKKIMRPSFISTANVDDFLRDPTGNRRFIVIPVSEIQWTYPQNESLQIMAQFKFYFEHGQYRILKSSVEDKIKLIVDSYTPDDISETIIEMYKIKFDALSTAFSGPYLGMDRVTPALVDIARNTQCSLRRVQSVIKSKGFSKRFKNGTRYYGAPLQHAHEGEVGEG